jgi:outer membrane protein assembly factor BamA
VHESTVFRDFGPVAGSTASVGFEFAPKFGGSLSRQTVDGDLRYYQRLGANGVLAFRARGLKSWGDNPGFLYFGGNSEMRGYEYLEFIGHKAFFANMELRVPLVEAMLTPLGVVGGLRGTAFVNVGGAGINGQSFTPFKRGIETIPVLVDYEIDPVFGAYTPITVNVDFDGGFRLKDARASYGIGLQSFLLGFPMHFDWSWKTHFNRDYEDLIYYYSGGSEAFRKVKFSFWIGYDF